MGANTAIFNVSPSFAKTYSVYLQCTGIITKSNFNFDIMEDNKLSSKPFLKPTSFFNIKPSNFEEKEDPKTPPKTQNNPFLLLQKNDSDEGAQSTDSSVKKENSNELDQAGQTRLNLFSNASNVKTTALLTENVGFVFGQNLHERVVSTQNSDDFQKNATLDLLFSSKTSDNDRTEESNLHTNNTETATVESEANSSSVDNNLSLVEAARKYEELRGAQKRKYEEVETVTGEEAENNILEINCKLFTFLTGNWEERGRGQMRLNDTKSCHNKQQATTSSRLVFRASGSLRVFINTNVWDGMVCEQSSPRSLRITALDSEGQIKIYLVMGRIEDINLLSKALSRRIDQERTRKEKEDKNKENENKRKSDQTGSQEETEDDEPATKKASIIIAEDNPS